MTSSTVSPTGTTHDRARVPADLDRLFAQFVNAGDVDGLVSLFEFDALCVPQPGVMARGPDGIRGAMSWLCSTGAQLELTTDAIHVASDLALLTNTWVATDPDGSTFGGRTTEVARQQPDGRWLVVIADPSWIA